MRNLIIGFIFGVVAMGSIRNLSGRNSAATSPSSPTATTHEKNAIRSRLPTESKSVDSNSIAGKTLSSIPKNEANSVHETIPDSSAFEAHMRNLEQETERAAGQLWQKTPPRGQITSRVENADGSVVEMEQTDKGDVISRQFNGDTLLALEWKTAGGKFLIRTYNADGSEKGISVGAGQNASYTFITDLLGKPTYKEYASSDGSKFIAKYENGRTIEQWYVTRDGRYVRIN